MFNKLASLKQLSLVLLIITLIFISWYSAIYSEEMNKEKNILLPKPEYDSNYSLEKAIFKRHSLRSYKQGPLTLREISQILWAAAGKNIDGVTGPTRTFPSAGGIYPQQFYLIVDNVEKLDKGIYRYHYQNHRLAKIKEGSYSQALSDAALGQAMIAKAPISIVITTQTSKTTSRYGQRGEKYVLIDVGFTGENIYLQAQTLNLGTVAVGAFSQTAVAELLNLTTGETPVLIMPVGKR